MARRSVVRTVSISPPVGGLNARDPVSNMDAVDAVLMENIFPGTSDVAIRKGYEEHATGLPDIVETLMVYTGFTSQVMFAVSSGSVFNATASTAVGTAVVTGLTNSQIQHTNFTDQSGTNWLYCVNGADAPRVYNGSAWTSVSAASTPALIGPTPADMINVNVHASRLWFVKKNSLSAYYLPVGVAGGTATEFDLGPVFRLGGKLMASGSWTLDAGEGMDDHTCFVTDRGEVAVYKGTDPTSANTWAKVGTYRLAPPIGYRCFVKYAGDLVLITTDGFYPLSKALQMERGQNQAISDKIRDLVREDAALFKSQNGWEGFFYPGAPFLLFNIPDTNQRKQYAMNTLTGSWCKFTGMNAYSWCLYGDEPYFGGNGSVYRAWSGYTDNGGFINGDALQAYSDYKVSGRVKRFTMARPIILADGPAGVRMGIATDYGNQDVSGDITVSASTSGVWDTGTWDVATWGGDPTMQRRWQTLGALGTVGGLRMKVKTQGTEIRWQSTDVVFEAGGII